MSKKKHTSKSSATNQSKLKRYLSWIDDNILLLLSGFLLVFIPLYPKLPLFEAIPGYIVRVRLEDLLILLTGFIWLVQVFRKKITFQTPLTKVVLAYAVVGLLSTLSAIFLTQTVPFETLHIGKTLLHYFRYLEYFSLFFILYSAIKSKKDLQIMLATLMVTLIGVGLYGIGQKYLYWPVYSTMNREFSKGIRLYLTEHARVQSTFGGHYDLAAYLVIILPLIVAVLYAARKRTHQLALWVVFLLGLWLLVVSASRTSFVAFLFALVVVIGLRALDYKTWKEKLLFAARKASILLVVIASMMLLFGDDMYERLTQTLQGYPAIYEPYKTAVNQTEWIVTEYIPTQLGLTEETKDKIKTGQLADKPENAISTEEAEVLVASDQRPSQQKPSDVYIDVPDTKKVATTSADGTIEITEIEVPRTYSDNALRHGLSLAIRLDTLWPRALEGFYRNPVLGSGYATLTKETVGHFTEAESTDNNFLRTLGETGLLGFITFYGAVVLALVWAYRIWQEAEPKTLVRGVAIGFIAGTAGLLLNATYIDVFAASKVAFTYWSITGIVLAILGKELLSEKRTS